MIISPKLKTLKKKNEIRDKILNKIGREAPFELYLVTPEEYQGWYRYFVKEKVEV